VPDHTDDPRAAEFEDGVLSEQDALAVWSRAAQLQEETDARSDPLRLPSGATPHRAPGAAGASLSLAAETRVPAGMYLVREILAAGRDAGIADRHVRMALAEHDALGSSVAIAVENIDAGVRDQMIGVPTRTVRASRVISESTETVLERLRAAASAAPWSLEFDSLIGGHPTNGGVLRFAVPVIGAPRDASKPARALNRFIYQASRAGMQHLHVMVEPRGTAELPGCAVTITGDLRAGEQRSIGIYRTLGRLLTGVAATGGTIVGASLGSMAGAGPALAGAALGLVGGVLASRGYLRAVNGITRWEHRTAHQVLTEELEALLRRVQRPSDEALAFPGPATAPTPRLVRGNDPDHHASMRAPLVSA
jgi:hypothetical protein